MQKDEDQKFPNQKLLTVSQFSEKHSWPVGGLRHLLFHKPNGFEEVIRRVGRKILISEQHFFKWIESINADDPDAQTKR